MIWGDNIGWENVSAYGMGVMGYTTANIDSIGMEGIRFTDHYAQPSCTAGCAAFITGQYPIRSGLTTVGQLGDKLGLQATSPSLAEVLKDAGYATGHFGKNHLGDRKAVGSESARSPVLRNPRFINLPLRHELLHPIVLPVRASFI